MTQLPAGALHKPNCTQHIHCANSAHINSRIPVIPQDRPLILSLFPVLGFSHRKPLYLLFGASGMQDLYLESSISWNLADYTAASWHALSIHCPYITSNQSEEITKNISFITATKSRKHPGMTGMGVGEKGPF